MPARRKKVSRKFIKRIKNRFSRGTITTTVLLGVVIIGSILLVSGIGPKYQITPKDPNAGGFVPDIEDKTINEKSLQLKTIKFKKCESTAAVDFLLDRTGSMSDSAPDGQRKLDKLKEATLTFVNSLSDDSVLGIQTFSSSGITDDVPIALFRDNKAVAESKIKSLQAMGQTPTTDALRFSLNKLKEGQSKFNDRQMNFIFVSDGEPVPNDQDPRLPQNNPDPSQEIKNLGITIYTIGILDANQIRKGRVQELLKHIASSPEKSFIAPDGNQLVEIYNQIRFELCKKAG